MMMLRRSPAVVRDVRRVRARVCQFPAIHVPLSPGTVRGQVTVTNLPQ
jgi:hypothetical protein